MPKTKVINMSLPLPLYEDLGKVAKKQEVSRSEILKRALRIDPDNEKAQRVYREYLEKNDRGIEPSPGGVLP